MPFEFPPIDVWLLWTGNCPSELPVHEVSVEEESRAARYRIPEKSRQFLLGRLLGRQIVASQWGCSPRDLLWPASGVPRVTLPGGQRPGTISLSHSQDFLAIALASSEFQLGVDIEQIDGSLRPESLITAMCMEEELEGFPEVDSLPSRAEVLRLFTLKESLFKALESQNETSLDFLNMPSSQDFLSLSHMVRTLYTTSQSQDQRSLPVTKEFYGQRNALLAPAEWSVQLTRFPAADFIGSVAIAARDVATIPDDCDWRWDWSLTANDAIPDQLRSELGIWGAEFRRLRVQLTPAGK